MNTNQYKEAPNKQMYKLLIDFCWCYACSIYQCAFCHIFIYYFVILYTLMALKNVSDSSKLSCESQLKWGKKNQIIAKYQSGIACLWFSSEVFDANINWRTKMWSKQQINSYGKNIWFLNDYFELIKFENWGSTVYHW